MAILQCLQMTVLFKLVCKMKEVEIPVTLSPAPQDMTLSMQEICCCISSACNHLQHQTEFQEIQDLAQTSRAFMTKFVDKICCTPMNTIWQIHWSHLTHAQPPIKLEHFSMKFTKCLLTKFYSEKHNVLKKVLVNMEERT